MSITLTKQDAGDFELTSPDLPAPLAVGSSAALALAAALVGDLTPAFKTDRMVWAPQSREPLGLWVKEDGQIELWIAGVNHPLTADGAKALGNALLLDGAPYKVGDELQTVIGLGAVAAGTIVQVMEVYWTDELRFKVQDPDGRLAENVAASALTVPPPIQTYEVIQDGQYMASRSVHVQARTPGAAATLAEKEFQKMGRLKGWRILSRGDLDIIGIDVDTIQVVDQNGDADLNAADGFVVSKQMGVQAYRDADNNSAFDGDDQAALAYVTARALAGSPRHQRALRLALGL